MAGFDELCRWINTEVEMPMPRVKIFYNKGKLIWYTPGQFFLRYLVTLFFKTYHKHNTFIGVKQERKSAAWASLD